MTPPPGIDTTWRGLIGKVVHFHLEGGHTCRMRVHSITSDDRRIIGHTEAANPDLVRWWEIELRRIVAISVEVGDS